MDSKEWLEAYRAGRADERQFLLHPTYVQGHCFPQGHMPVVTTSSKTPGHRLNMPALRPGDHIQPGPSPGGRQYRRRRLIRPRAVPLPA